MKNLIQKLWYQFVKYITKIAAHMYFRIKIEGSENIPSDGPFLLLSNHQSFLDPVLCTAASKRQLCFMARDTLFLNPAFGWLIRSLNAIPIKRGEADLGAMKLVIQKLRQGRAVCLYPEGTRTLTGQIAEVKPGFGLLTKRGKAGVVPVVIDGMYEAWPKTKRFPRPGKLYVKVGEYISPEQIKEYGEEKFAKVLTKTMREMQDSIRTKMGREPISY